VSVCPTNFDEKVECPFVDRKEFIEAFEKALRNIDQNDYSTLVYYGVAGIGKTSLRKELPTLLEKHNESDKQTRVIWTSIDFATEQYRQPYKFLEVLSSQLRQKYNIKFNSFDIALATYWKKVNPRVPLVKENYSEESVVRDVLEICNEFVPINLIPNLLTLAKSLPERYQKWALKRKEDISRLSDLEPAEIDELLPVYWAYDLADHLQNTSESAVIFIDTYEALWEKEREKGSFNDRDKWLRKLIENIQKFCLWVICGRESLRWEEVDEDWKNYLNQLKIGKLPEEDALYLLKHCGILEEDIQKVLIESSEGVPYYLELSIDTYRKIKKRKQPAPEDFSKVPDGIFCRFVKYLDREEKETLKILSVPRYWDRELFEILVEKFNTGYPATSFSELHSFSFMDVDDKGKCSMHQLMRKSLQAYQDKDLKKKVHKFVLDYYRNQLKDLDIKAITPEHELALTEAFYHVKEALEAEELYKWFISVSDPFYRAAFWQLITPMYEETRQILEAELGPQHPSIATTLNNLAALYLEMGEYEKALQLFQRALNIREKVLGTKHLDVAQTLNNLAELYLKTGEYEEALQLFQRALDIREKVLGTKHLDVAITLNNLAALYLKMGNYEKALHFFRRALDVRESTLGPEHTSVATTLNNLATLYLKMGNHEKALSHYKRALDIREKILGPKHPDVATTLNNLAAFYYQIGEYEKALQLFQRALDISENALGPEHISVATTLNNLAGPYYQIGEYEKAFQLYQRALDIREKVLGQQHPDFATTLNNLATLYRKMGDYKKALPIYQRVLDIRERTLGPQHSDVATILNNIALLYKNMGDYEKALPLYQRALEIVEKKFGQNHPNTATIKNNYNRLLLKMS
jgi:tetratricopeptide (TPR) repeat protein